MKRYIFLAIIILLCFVLISPAQKLLFEGDWQYRPLRPSNLTSWYGIHIYHDDNLQYSVGSESLNSGVVAENLNANQGTLEFWVRPNWDGNDGLDYNVLFADAPTPTSNYYRFYKLGSNSRLYFLVWDGSSTYTSWTDVSAWKTGMWYHIVGVWDSRKDVNGSFNIVHYIDGVIGTASTDATWVLAGTNYTISLGMSQVQTNLFNGVIAGRILNRPLTADEVTVNYAAGLGSLDTFVVDADVVWRGNYGDEVTSATYWHRGKLSDDITDGANDDSINIPTLLDTTQFVSDGNAILVSDGTGHSLGGFADGDPSGTTLLIDDGAGADAGEVEKVGVSLDFDGSSDYVSAGDPASLDFGVGDFSIEGWVSVTSGTVFDAIISKGRRVAWTLNNAGWILRIDGLGNLGATIADGAGYTDFDSGSNINDGKAHHVAAVFDRTDVLELYVDGISVGTKDITGENGSVDNAVNLYIGAQENLTSPRLLDGKVFEARAYSIELTAADVLWLATNPNPSLAEIFANTSANQGGGGADDDVVLYHNYRNQNLTDLSEYGNDGTHSGTPTYETEAYVSRNLHHDPGAENGGIGGITVGSTWTVTKDTTTVKYDTNSLELVATAADTGDECILTAQVLANGDDYWNSLWVYIDAIHASGNLFWDIDGSGNILSRQLDTGIDDRGTTYAVQTWLYYEQCFEADQDGSHNFNLRIAGEPEIVADSDTLNTGGVGSGSVSDTYTQNGVDYQIDEVGGVPGFDIEFDFTVAGVAKSINIYGYYSGNAGHNVDVNAWNGGSYDTLGQLPDAVADTLYSFSLTPSHTIGGAVNIQIEHTTGGAPTHDLFLDHVYLIDSIDATVYVDSGEIRENLIVNGGMESFQGGDPNIPTGWTNSSLSAGGMVKAGNGEADTERHTGDFCAKYVAADSSEGIQLQFLTLVSNTKYTLSVFLKGDAGGEAIQIFSTGFANDYTFPTTITTGWVEYRFAINPGTDAFGNIFFRSGAAGQTFYLDDVSLIPLDTADASTATKGQGHWPKRNPFFIGD